MERNNAFFAYVENNFLVMEEKLGKEKAIEIMRMSLEKGLKKAYDSMGFSKGNPADFIRCTKARDEAVGLRVEYLIENGVIIYTFHDDPFPNLKENLTFQEVCSTYMPFKVEYLLGKNWKYKIIKHLWQSDDCIEFAIEEGK